ncbi:MAG TPA: HyaD/HybD family hydrogenase maturation endopeptidase [Polyangiaceae bacterium]|nr:HyaD/HybD family hydrogenase maturation endopeptidase [Polyangiaceae bacterium]
MDAASLLVLGLGNPLCGDDGAGVAAVSRLRERYLPPPGVLVLDGGTLGLSLLPYLREARAVILVDAVAAQEPAGTLVRLQGDDVARAAAHRLSVHQIGVADLLDGARLLGGYPEVLVLVGVVPAHTELSIERSPAVQARVDDLVQAVVDEAGRMGHVFERREAVEEAAHDRVLGL